MEEAQQVISPAVAALSSFAEEQSPEVMDRIFEEFNSLSVIYRRPSQAFVKVRRLQLAQVLCQEVDRDDRGPPCARTHDRS